MRKRILQVITPVLFLGLGIAGAVALVSAKSETQRRGGGATAPRVQTVRQPPSPGVVKKPHTSTAVHDGVVDQQGVARVLDSDAGAAAVVDDVIDQDRVTAVAQNDPMIVTASNDVSDENR